MLTHFDTTGSAIRCNTVQPEKRNRLRYGAFPSQCNALQRMNYHS